MTTVNQADSGRQSVLAAATEEQFEAARDAALSLVRVDKTIRRIFAAMVTARRVYGLARIALERETTREGHDWPDGVEEFLIQAALAEADVAYSRADVACSLAESVMPFVDDEVAIEMEEARVESLEHHREVNQQRLSSPVMFSAGDKAHCVARGETLVVIGSKADVDTYTDDCVRCFRAKSLADDFENAGMPFTLVRLSRANSDLGETEKYFISIPKVRWSNLLQHTSRAEKVLDQVVESLDCRRLDMLVVEEAFDAGADYSDVDSLARSLEDSHRFLSRWCKKQQAALVLVVPIVAEELALQLTEAVTRRLESYVLFSLLEKERNTDA